ncbi:AraC family ligand binding domain-containing protein [Rubrivirga sp.]|uniref:AraC family ligand binding domain-containing protein n=1 Tax=Rubrivirga sp. TaxID=1885344 RepID=UPI003C77F4D5
MGGILDVDFSRDKYGPELLVDVGRAGSLDGYVLDERPHRSSFYDIILVAEGEGTFALDGQAFSLEAGRVCSTSPGQIRVWRTTGVVGTTLFFPGEFIEAFFADDLFLHMLQFFHTTSRRRSSSRPTKRRGWPRPSSRAARGRRERVESPRPAPCQPRGLRVLEDESRSRGRPGYRTTVSGRDRTRPSTSTRTR